MAGIKSREESIREEMDAPLNLDVNVDVRIPKSNQMTGKKYKCTCCGASWDTQKNHFSKSADVLWQSNDGYIHVEMLTIISLLIYLMVMKVRQSNIFVCNLVGCTILKD